MVSHPRPIRPGDHGGYFDVCAQRCVFVGRSRRRSGDGCGGGLDGGSAVDGIRGLGAPAIRLLRLRVRLRAVPAGQPISAPVAGIVAVVAVPRQPRPLPASSAPVLRLRPARTAATIMTMVMATAAATKPRRPITAAARSTMVVVRITAVAVTGACRISAPRPPDRQLVVATFHEGGSHR